MLEEIHEDIKKPDQKDPVLKIQFFFFYLFTAR